MNSHHSSSWCSGPDLSICDLRWSATTVASPHSPSSHSIPCASISPERLPNNYGPAEVIPTHNSFDSCSLCWHRRWMFPPHGNWCGIPLGNCRYPVPMWWSQNRFCCWWTSAVCALAMVWASHRPTPATTLLCPIPFSPPLDRFYPARDSRGCPATPSCPLSVARFVGVATSTTPGTCRIHWSLWVPPT